MSVFERQSDVACRRACPLRANSGSVIPLFRNILWRKPNRQPPSTGASTPHITDKLALLAYGDVGLFIWVECLISAEYRENLERDVGNIAIFTLNTVRLRVPLLKRTGANL